MRIISLILKQKLEAGTQYDLVLKKITTQAGTELSADNKTTLKIVYDSQNPPAIIDTTVADTSSEVVQDVPGETTFDKPVPIDKLPQTGPGEMLCFLLMAAGVAFLVQKKLQRGA